MSYFATLNLLQKIFLKNQPLQLRAGDGTSAWPGSCYRQPCSVLVKCRPSAITVTLASLWMTPAVSKDRRFMLTKVHELYLLRR